MIYVLTWQFTLEKALENWLYVTIVCTHAILFVGIPTSAKLNNLWLQAVPACL